MQQNVTATFQIPKFSLTHNANGWIEWKYADGKPLNEIKRLLTNYIPMRMVSCLFPGDHSKSIGAIWTR